MAVATAALGEFAHRERTADQWLAALAPYLTPQATAEFYGTDPAQVPVSTVGAVTVSSPSPYLAEAIAVTDAGPYRVLLSRVAGDAPWLVDRIEPTE